MRIYYQTLSGASIEELKSTDAVKQTQWLLSELLKEYQNKEDDLVKSENEGSVSILADIEDILKVQKKDEEKLRLRRREKIAELNSLVQHLEQVYQTKETIDEMFDKIKVDAAEIKKSARKPSDDIIISDGSSDKVDSNVKLDNKSDITDENNKRNSNDEDIKTKITHAADEL